MYSEVFKAVRFLFHWKFIALNAYIFLVYDIIAFEHEFMGEHYYRQAYNVSA